MPAIHATPNTTLVDEKVAIKLIGFDPGSKVTVRSYLPAPELLFEAHGHFVVDVYGEMALTDEPSSGGTYTGPGPFRGVIDMFGTAGGLLEFRAALLASRGFVAYALPYYRYEDLPTGVTSFELDYFEEATDWLQEQAYVLPGGIGVVGVSWGAEVVTLMATTFPDKISACVSISGACVRTLMPMKYKGKPLPYLGSSWDRIRFVQKEPQIINILNAIDPLETAPEEAFLKLERAQHLLFVVGMNDLNVNAPLYMDVAERRLKASGCNNYEILRYRGAGHIIEPPYAPLTLKSYHGLFGSIVEWGGRPREHQRAQEDAWPRLLQFLNKYVGTETDKIFSICRL